MDIISGTNGNYRKLMLAGQFWERSDLDALKEYVDVCAKVQKPRIILDLERLSFINSQALGLIVKLHAVCKDAGGKLILFQPKSSVKEVIEITGLATFMTITYTTDELTHAMR
jgi:anti-anti-sigma factor